MVNISLIQLPYAEDALQPVISAETIGFHYGKHLQTYVNNLNALLPGTPYADLSLEEIVKKSQGTIYNNAGQVLNHQLYFTQFRAPRDGNVPEGKVAEAMIEQFGSFETFKEEFEKMGASIFGSGWVWLSSDEDGTLHITQEANADNPIKRGLKPLLTFDVWEHAYYLDYQNRRSAHLSALWHIVNWEEIERRYRQ